MSVLIKGMKMPESCFYCRFRKKVNPEEIMCLASGEIFEETFTATIEMRNGAGKCPLTEIPEPHGRLIDVDRLLNDATRYVGSPPHYEPKLSRLEVKLAPTVIEAEGSEDE